MQITHQYGWIIVMAFPLPPVTDLRKKEREDYLFVETKKKSWNTFENVLYSFEKALWSFCSMFHTYKKESIKYHFKILL